MHKLWRELFAPYVDEVSLDALGSVIAVKKSKKENAKRVMLDAHIDEIGLMVTSIDEKAFKVHERRRRGRAHPARARGRCTWETEIAGIIGIAAAPAKCGREQKTLKIDELAIDVGMDEKAVRSLVAAGDWVTFSQECAPLLNGQMTGKSFDDRASVCALLYAAQVLADEPLDVDVYFVLSVQEETNLAGAGCAAYGTEPDAALVIDVTHAKTPDNADCPFDVGRRRGVLAWAERTRAVCASAKGAGGGARRRRKGGGRRREYGHERMDGAGEPDRVYRRRFCRCRLSICIRRPRWRRLATSRRRGRWRPRLCGG